MNESDDMEAGLTPYARALGISLHEQGKDAPILTVEFDAQIEGRPGAFHGGATGGLLETAGYAALGQRLAEEGREHQLKPINITVQYLSAGKPQTAYAKGRVTRLGRRNANVFVEAWQADSNRPFATATMNIFMTDPQG